MPIAVCSDDVCLATGQAAIAVTDASGHASWPHHWGALMFSQRGLVGSALDLPCAVPRAAGKRPEMHAFSER
jgi:hypothetical protein